MTPTNVIPPTEVKEPTKSGPHPDEDLNILDEETPLTEEEVEEEEIPDEEETEEGTEETPEEEEEQEGIEIPHDRPTPKEVKAKYPNFFKDFPELKEGFFREIEYTKLFPTVEDAKEALEDNSAFRVLQDSAFKGDSGPILQAIQKSDPTAFTRFARNFIPTLYKMDQNLYSETVNPLFENLVRYAFNEGKKHNNENLQNAALVLSELLFETDGIAKGEKTIVKKLEPLKDTKEQDATLFRTAFGKVSPKIVSSMNSLIAKDLDPNRVFSPFLRDKIVEEVRNRIDKQLEMDDGHRRVMSSRWARAKDQGYIDAELSKIISTYLARAKALIPSIRDDVRKRALATKQRNSDKREERVKSRTPERREATGGRPTKPPSKNGKVNYREMSDLDILNS